MLQMTAQTSRKYRIATFNAMLDAKAICPANHDIGYHRGWYYLDGEPQQRPDVTRRAKEFERRDDVAVRFNRSFNTYTLVPVDPETGCAERGSVDW